MKVNFARDISTCFFTLPV